MNEEQRAYEKILGRPLAEFRGPCTLYEYTALGSRRFAPVHTADTIKGLLDWLADVVLYNDIAFDAAVAYAGGPI